MVAFYSRGLYMKVLVLGSGAKDHALAWWISKSSLLSGLYMAKGNAATEDYAVRLPDVDPSSKEDVYAAVLAYGIDLVVIGTEAPLSSGVIEYLKERGIKTFGAPEGSIRLEDDKEFSRKFAERHGIRIPPRQLFQSKDGLEDFLSAHAKEEFIVKSNNISPSRETLRSHDYESLLEYSKHMLKRGAVLIEKFIPGLPITATILLDDEGYMMLPIASEYTEKDEDDNTPTGGMGAICPVPIDDEIMAKVEEKIIKPTLSGMLGEGISYKGVLTFSIIIPEDRDPVLVDYHVRFNDPAAQAFIPLVKNDFLEIVEAMNRNNLKNVKLSSYGGFSVAVVLASEGYPVSPVIGRDVKGLTAFRRAKVRGLAEVFVGAVDKINGREVTVGGRNITVVGIGENLEDANKMAYNAVKDFQIEGGWFRRDIGNKFFDENREKLSLGRT